MSNVIYFHVDDPVLRLSDHSKISDDSKFLVN